MHIRRRIVMLHENVAAWDGLPAPNRILTGTVLKEVPRFPAQ
jgi:hypothetical protein